MNYYTLSNNIPTTFLDEENDFLLVSGLSFNAHLMHPLTELRVTLLNDLYTVSTKRSVQQLFIKISNMSLINSHLI